MIKELENMVHMKRFKVLKIFKNKIYLLIVQDAPSQTQNGFRGFLNLANRPKNGKLN